MTPQKAICKNCLTEIISVFGIWRHPPSWRFCANAGKDSKTTYGNYVTSGPEAEEIDPLIWMVYESTQMPEV